MKFILVYKVFNDQISSEIKGDLNFWSVHCMMCERKMKFNHLMLHTTCLLFKKTKKTVITSHDKYQLKFILNEHYVTLSCYTH